MQHHFDVDIAVEYGVLESILLNHFQFWDAKNRANNVGYHDGRYWTYNSAKAFTLLFPYASEYQIRMALKHLEDAGLILTGNYNKSSYDRTTWYALSETAISMYKKPQMEAENKPNGSGEIATPIPDNNTDNSTDNVTILVERWNSICRSLPKVIKVDAKRKRQICMRLSEHTTMEIINAMQKVEESDFLSGRDGKWQNCNFDWLFKNSNNIIKVLEGNYDNKTRRSKVEQELINAYNDIGGENVAESYDCF